MEKEDHTPLFKKYIAEKLNQFDPHTKALLTHKINNLIIEAEMSTISNHAIPARGQSTSSSHPLYIILHHLYHHYHLHKLPQY